VEKTNIDQDAAALGAAAIAAVGTGLWSDFSRLDEIHQIQEILNPIPENAEKYNQILPLFLETAEMLTALAKS
jgi:xylulokinase